MLGNCSEKMVVISPTTNQWPQNQIDEKSLTTMDKSQPQNHQHHHQIQPPPPPPQQQALKCPRCDSSNTKFCYYNNYSLSQPRHFCKACKRYWTRGGTLRNVPVGGGCRKNKRVKRASASSPSSAAAAVEGSSSSSLNPNSSQSQIDISISAQINPLFYGLPPASNPSEINLPFTGRFNSRIDTVSGYDLQPQLNALALGFSSGKQIQDVVTSSNSSSMLSNYSIFGSSLLASSLHQQKFPASALTPFEELHLNGNGNTESAGICVKEVKVELQDQQQSRFDWNNNNNHNHNQNNQIDQIGFSSLDPSLYWNPNTTTSVGVIWHDPAANIGSSLTSLI